MFSWAKQRGDDTGHQQLLPRTVLLPGILGISGQQGAGAPHFTLIRINRHHYCLGTDSLHGSCQVKWSVGEIMLSVPFAQWHFLRAISILLSLPTPPPGLHSRGTGSSSAHSQNQSAQPASFFGAWSYADTRWHNTNLVVRWRERIIPKSLELVWLYLACSIPS